MNLYISTINPADLDGVNIRPDYRKEFVDDKTLVDEWQMRRQLTGDCLPALLDSPILDVTRHQRYQFPDPAAAHRFTTVEKALQRFGDRRAVILNLRDSQSFEVLKARLEADPRLTVEAKRESLFYAEQSDALATFIRVLGMTLSIIFSIGAVIGAMITMYSSVANRISEIGTMRALGFRRASILWAFLLESLLIGLLGGSVGLGAKPGLP